MVSELVIESKPELIGSVWSSTKQIFTRSLHSKYATSSREKTKIKKKSTGTGTTIKNKLTHRTLH